ncbi:MAG: enoyl-CoA hydratase/isomerase family protein [Gemmatimonadota bacterium]|nr:MAG: enoyl-CoA hydratase/isomerase family protein [Gemmatimonadota bacterium]
MLHTDLQDGVLVLRLDHRKAHALDVELCQALSDAVSEIEATPAVRAVVLTGSGSIFCAGVDMFRVLDGGPEYVDEFVPALDHTLRSLFRLPRPVVAAINGYAIAGGCVLAAACDYRIMAQGSGTIGVPELTVGMPFPLVAVEILRFATSDAHLQELIYQGRTYSVDDAYELGLVDELSDPGVLQDRALEVARQLGSEPAARFLITKQQLRGPAVALMERSHETDADVRAAWKDPTTIAAIRRYVEGMKRGRGSR